MITGCIARALLIAGALTLTACGGNSSSPQNSQNPDDSTAPQQGAAQAQEEDVSFDLNLSALLEKEVIPGTFDDAAAANLMNGTMQITNLANGEVELHPWTVNIDESDLSNVQSFQTLALVPGDYAFELALSKAAHSYAGTVVHTLTDGATDDVAMTIRPVIGSSQVDVNLIAELIDFKFSFSGSELNAANLSNPSMGITIGGNPEQIFVLDPASGLSEHMLLNLTPGQYDISLRLLDSGIQVGKSIEEQEQNITITQGLDVSMDIIPLHGEFALALSVEGGDATLNLQIPAEVVEEAGDITELQSVLSVTGPEFPLQEQVLTLTQAGSVYTSTATLTDVFFSELTFEMAFNDLSTGAEIGYCVNNIMIDSNSKSVECSLTLRRRQIVSGSLMSTVGINVQDPDGLAVPGAVITVDDVEVAITNSATFSTEGYSKIYLKQGTHNVRAQFGAAFGEVSYESVPLSVANINIVLDQLDTDGDGVEDNLDACPTEAADTADGCPVVISNLMSDLVTGKAGEFGHGGEVRIRLSDGQGGYTEVSETLGQQGVSHNVGAGDFNQDGTDDVAMIRQDGALFVALGPLSGGITLVQVATMSNTNNNASALKVGDYNNDNVPDIAVMGYWQHATFLGNGDGSFNSEITFAGLAPGHRSMNSGDFDQDGNLDIVMHSASGNCALTIHYGDGTGNFTSDSAHGFFGLLTADNVQVADTDADGDLDIITGGYTTSAKVFVNNGNRNFTQGTVIPKDPAAGGAAVFIMLADDLNNDNAADLITTLSGDSDILDVQINDGSGNFGAVTPYIGAPGARNAVVFDNNADGIKDVAVVNALVFGNVAASNNITIMQGNGDGTFQTPSILPGYRNNMTIDAGNFD